MKRNTKQILAWLYPEEGSVRWVKKSELAWVMKDLTKGGLTSLLHYLQNQKKIVMESFSNEIQVSISSHGMRALETSIPVFSPQRREWRGDWTQVVFIQAPSNDAGFRFLRKLLLKYHGLVLARGIFLFPGNLPEEISTELRSSYEGAVSVMRLRDWAFGDERSIMGQNFTMSDLSALYSSISKDINQLLIKNSSKKGFSDQSKLLFSSVFDRLFHSFENDPGLLQYYFPQVESGLELLFSLRSVLSIGY